MATRISTLEEWAGSAPTTIALVFTDIVGSTSLCEAMGDAAWIEVLVEHFAEARNMLRGYDCHIIKIIGDSFMIAFRTANEALKFCADFSQDISNEKIKIRAGIHVGAVRVINDDIYGGMVNYTARVVNSIKDDGVVLSNTAKSQIESELGKDRSFGLFIRFSQRLKGFDQIQILWRLNTERWWQTRVRQAFPISINIDPTLQNPCEAFCLHPASLEEIDWIAKLEEKSYSTVDAIPYSILKGWYKINPTGFWVIKNKFNQKIGHIDLLPIRPEAIKPFLEGNIREREIKPDNLYTPLEKSEIKEIYIESVIIDLPNNESKAPVLYALLASFESIVLRICDPKNLESIYAMEASRSGERFIRQLGFQPLSYSEDRDDGHMLFRASFLDVQTNISNIIDV